MIASRGESARVSYCDIAVAVFAIPEGMGRLKGIMGRESLLARGGEKTGTRRDG